MDFPSSFLRAEQLVGGPSGKPEEAVRNVPERPVLSLTSLSGEKQGGQRLDAGSLGTGSLQMLTSPKESTSSAAKVKARRQEVQQFPK